MFGGLYFFLSAAIIEGLQKLSKSPYITEKHIFPPNFEQAFNQYYQKILSTVSIMFARLSLAFTHPLVFPS